MPSSTSTEFTATYSPEDNKLRLYATSRLDEETYARVKKAGFSWAPKQKLFVAPMWTPGREDLLIALCGEIGDEDTTLVERQEERAGRFEGYSSKRLREAMSARAAVSAIADNIPFGQPILVGHHSERHARKDQERIESGMRKAVDLWKTSSYWEARAEGAIHHAKYKELPAVRARRIKTIEADKRKQEREIADAEGKIRAWSQAGLTFEQAKQIANYCGGFYRCFPLAEYPREAPASQYEGSMSLWSALDGGVITAGQAAAIALKAYPRTIARANRWIEHYSNRIAYEKAMLGIDGGTAADRFAVEVGGQVLVGGTWLTVLKVNKRAGAINSVRTNRKFVPLIGIEDVSDYRAPSAEEAATVKAAVKAPPLCNYPGEGFVHVTKAQWAKIHADYKSASRCIDGTDTHAKHRVRKAMGGSLGLRDGDTARYALHCVYITDQKRVDPPAADGTPAPVVPKPRPDIADMEARKARQAANAAAKLARSATDSGFRAIQDTLKAGGVRVVAVPQLFPTPAHIVERMADAAALRDGMRVLEPSAGTGNILAALAQFARLDVVAVEINGALAGQLERTGNAGTVVHADFLERQPETLGHFDRILMNPPFENGADIRHITHAAKFLRPGGRLVAICANGPRQREKLGQIVEERRGTWEDLPEDTFASQGTKVRTAMIVIEG